MAHQSGSEGCFLSYPSLSSSRHYLRFCHEEVVKSQTPFVASLCKRLGWVINEKKSDLIPSQVATYLGFSIDTRIGLAYPAVHRIDRWFAFAKDFLVKQAQPALLWRRVSGASGFSREASSLRQVSYPSLLAPASLVSVPGDRFSLLLVSLNQDVRLAIAW